METAINEIADGIFRLSTFVPDIAPPQGFTFNQFLIRGDEPMLFHAGLRLMFPTVRDAVSQLIKPEQLRWIAFGHVEADECGALNEWLATAPHGRSRARPYRLHGVAERHGRPSAATTRGRRSHRSGRQARALPRHAAHSPRLGGRRHLRGKHQDAAVRRPVHPSRERPSLDGARHCRTGDRDRGHVQVFEPEPRHGRHDPKARGVFTADARADARSLVYGRLPCGPARARRRLRPARHRQRGSRRSRCLGLPPGIARCRPGHRADIAAPAGVRPTRRSSRIRSRPACCRCRRAAARSSWRTGRAR